MAAADMFAAEGVDDDEEGGGGAMTGDVALSETLLFSLDEEL